MSGGNAAIPKWTTEQLAGITTTGVNLLVSAAAGSGKTAVLAARCAHLVCDAKPPCGVDGLLVVTFTEAAAAEMKGRIEQAIRQRQEQDPDDDRLLREVAQIDRLQVGTLHGFCSRLLRQNFHALGLDPNFAILDGDEGALLRAEVVRELFAERYETDEAGAFQRLVDVYGDGNDETLQSHVLRTHELLCSVVEPEAWLAEARGRVAEASAKPLRETALGNELAAIVRRRLASLAERCAHSIDAVRQMAGFDKYVDYLRLHEVEIAHWIRSFGDCNFDSLAAAINDFKAARLPTVKGDTPNKETAKALVDAVRDAKGDKGSIKPLTRFTEAQWTAGLATTAEHVETFLELVREFQVRYERAKERARGVDFADLERLTLRLLRTDDGRPSPIAESLHQRIQHVLVDEYQDINGVQDAILRLVSRECLGESKRVVPNLFCVGDVKQSIYGFRLAEPDRFLRRAEDYRDGCGGQVIDLQANFRSRGPLLEAINALFERLMTREAADINYDESQRLKPAATYPPAAPDGSTFTGSPIELNLLPLEVTDVAATAGEAAAEAAADLDRTQREASFIAAKIHELMGDGEFPRRLVAEKSGQLRPIERRDIVILLRATKYKAEQYATILKQHQIDTHRDSGSGYFDTTEVRDVLSLLRLLDNTHQDVPLAAVLRSPLAGLADAEDCFARVRLAYPIAAVQPFVPFHEAVRRYAAEKDDDLAARLKDFLDQLHRWRTMARMRPLAELLEAVYDDTGYVAFCGGLENGDQRVANLHDLLGRAKQFGTFSRQGLYRFLRHVERLEEEADQGQPSVLGEGENVVRIMSVHKSKGLEFPVVFLPDLGKRFNLADSGQRIMVDRARFLGMEAVDEAKQVRYPSLASTLVSERLRQQALAEELRVLYVAMTRAREHLILVGTCGPEKPEQWRTLHGGRRGPMPAEMVLGAGTALDWIGPAAAAITGSGGTAIEVIPRTAEEIADVAQAATARKELSPRQAARAALRPLDPPPPENPVASKVIERLGYRYPHEPFAKLRAAIPVTEWARLQKAAAVDADASPSPVTVDKLLPLPRVLAGELPLSPTEKGTATHLVLQHLDFLRPCRGDDLRDQIDRMISRKLMLPAQAEAVDRAAVEWFAGCDVGKLVRATAKEDVFREIPFNLALPPDALGASSSADPRDQVMLRGRIDLMLRRDGEYVVIDYKTDDVTERTIALRRESYRPQVGLYRQAIEKLTGAKVAAVYLVFLKPRVVVPM